MGLMKAEKKEVVFYEGDVANKELLRKIFTENEINSSTHFPLT